MKKILIVLFLLPVFGYTQGVPKEYRKMNTMIISIDSDDPISDISNHMMDFGFGVEEINRDLGTIKTEPKSIGAGQWQIRVRVKDNKVEFQHFYKLEITINGVSSSGWDQNNFKRGAPGSPQSKMSDGIFTLVSSLNPKIEYFKK